MLPTYDDIHAWTVPLDLPELKIQQLFPTLSEDERERANRFHFSHHRSRFIAARAILRIIVGKYLQIKPQDVEFEYSPKGKPNLGAKYRESKLAFNLSHSHELALYGFSCDRRIGVDTEHIRPVKDLLSLAKRFFVRSEYEFLNHLPLFEREKAFFQIWTAKEAYLKAIGAGIGGGLEQVEVIINSDGTGTSLKIHETCSTDTQWSVISTTTPSAYVATIVVESTEWKLHQLILEKL